MSVVIELEDGRLRLLSKGADSAIFDVISSSVPEVSIILSKPLVCGPSAGCASADRTPVSHLLTQALKNSTSEHLDKFARSGLRTLCFGYRDIDPTFYRSWSEKFERANLVWHLNCTTLLTRDDQTRGFIAQCPVSSSLPRALIVVHHAFSICDVRPSTTERHS